MLDQSSVVANNTSTTSGYGRVRVNSQGVVTYADGGLQPAVHLVSSSASAGGVSGTSVPDTAAVVIVSGGLANVYVGTPDLGRVLFIRNSNSSKGINVIYGSTKIGGQAAAKTTTILVATGSAWLNLGSLKGT